MNKRDFLKKATTTMASLALINAWSCKTKAPSISGSLPPRITPFSLPPLPYAFDALEPHIDMMTMITHHGKHHLTYVTKLNDAIKGTVYESATIEDIIMKVSEQDAPAIRNNGGGHYNHSLFWESLTPTYFAPSNKLFIQAINESFGTYDQFKEVFTTSAKNVFGSGWTWLCVDSNNKLIITNTPNQDNPLMKNIVKNPTYPILGLDIWEHAYYLKYQNKRADYIAGFFNIINWKKVEERFIKTLK